MIWCINDQEHSNSETKAAPEDDRFEDTSKKHIHTINTTKLHIDEGGAPAKSVLCENIDDECMGCGQEGLTSRDIFRYGCAKNHFMCRDCAKARMLADIGMKKRPCCAVRW